LQDELADGKVYSQDAARAATLHAREGEIEEQLMAALERWSALST
jgi:ATP-binding cassette subfamily F protein uup